MSDSDLLTIADAAAALSVGEKRLRRLLAKPEYRDRTWTLPTETRTGTRTAVHVPRDLLTDLRARFEIQESRDNGDRDTDEDTPAERGHPEKRTGTASSASLGTVSTLQVAAIYEQRLAAEQESHRQVLAAKDETIAELRAALEHERESHQRTQAIAAMGAAKGQIAPMPETSTGTPADTSVSPTGDTESDDTRQIGVDIHAGVSAGQKAGFWARLFGYGRKD